jgi:ORF6N domain
MFEMTKEELENWRCQIGISNQDKMGLRYSHFCFTEPGVSMLSSILNSKIAIKVNIQIIRIFIRLREIMLGNKDILLMLEKLDKKFINLGYDVIPSRFISQTIGMLINRRWSRKARFGIPTYL